jgi:pilus assembly protein CpaB
VKVFVVKKDIKKAMPGDEALSGDFVKIDMIQQKFRPSTALTTPDSIKGKVALTDLAANQVLVDGQFVEPRVAQLTNAQRIAKGHVAVTVSVDPIHGVAGLLVPGDKVNMLVKEGDTMRYLYQNVNVLFIGSQAAPQPGETAAPTNPGSSLITFDVPADAAARIALASQKAEGGLYLALVPPDNSATELPAVDAKSLFPAEVTPYDHETK